MSFIALHIFIRMRQKNEFLGSKKNASIIFLCIASFFSAYFIPFISFLINEYLDTITIYVYKYSKHIFFYSWKKIRIIFFSYLQFFLIKNKFLILANQFMIFFDWKTFVFILFNFFWWPWIDFFLFLFLVKIIKLIHSNEFDCMLIEYLYIY